MVRQKHLAVVTRAAVEVVSADKSGSCRRQRGCLRQCGGCRRQCATVAVVSAYVVVSVVVAREVSAREIIITCAHYGMCVC